MFRIATVVYIFILLVVPATVNAGSPLFENLKSGAFETIDDHNQQDKWLVVMIWAHDCEVCEREVDDYQRFHRKHSDNNATVLGVTLDGVARQQAAVDFVTRHQLEFENLIAEPEVVAAYYQITTGSRWVGTPSFLIFGPDGELKAKQVGAVETGVVEAFIAANTGN